MSERILSNLGTQVIPSPYACKGVIASLFCNVANKLLWRRSEDKK